MDNRVHKSARKVQEALDQLGLDLAVVELPASTRTAAEAAAAVGTSVGQIVKSLIFRLSESGEPLLIVASGTNRVNEAKIGGYLGEGLVRADADFVREATGFVIGGVPPVGHHRPIRTLVDEDLLQYDRIWAAAGTPNAVFQLTPSDLLRMCGDEVLAVT